MLKKQLIRFLIVGIINTIFGYTLFAILIYIGLHYSLAVLIGTIVGILFNFKTTGKFVFDSHDNKLIFHFVGVYVIIYFLNVFGLWFLQKLGFDNMYFAGAIMIAPAAAVSFFLNRTFVFNKRSK